jgi:bifunctional non-homologous end joining protein LigD
MYAQLVQQLPEGNDWLYEVKFDGYRCLAGRDAAGVTLWSRRGNDFTAQFPNIAKACEQLAPRTLIDGEISPLTVTGASPSTYCNIIARKHRHCCSMRLTY